MSNRYFTAIFGILAVIGLASNTPAEASVLAWFGDCDRSGAGEVAIGEHDLNDADIYFIDCVDGFCEDDSTFQDLPNTHVILCSADSGAVNCVNQVQLNFETSQPYLDVFVHVERAGAELHELVYDNNKVGGVSSPGSLDGTSYGEEGEYVDISYGLGMVTPNKPHTLIISSPAMHRGNGRSLVDCVEVYGSEISNR